MGVAYSRQSGRLKLERNGPIPGLGLLRSGRSERRRSFVMMCGADPRLIKGGRWAKMRAKCMWERRPKRWPLWQRADQRVAERRVAEHCGGVAPLQYVRA